MGLRGRLALFFVAITVIPLTVAVVVLQLQLRERLGQIADAELTANRGAAILAIEAARTRAGDLASELVNEGAGPVLAAGEKASERFLQQQLDPGAVPEQADLVLLMDAKGRLLASRQARAHFAGLGQPDAAAVADAVAAGRPAPMAVLAVRQVEGGQPSRLLGWVATGVWTDRELLAQAPLGGGAAFVAGGRVLAAIGQPAAAVPAGELPPPGEVVPLRLAGEAVTATTTPLRPERSAAGRDSTQLLLWTDDAATGNLLEPALFILIPSVLLAAALGWVLAAGVVAPVRRAADAARAVAAGDLEQTLPASGGRELADLAVALNAMSAELAGRLEDLEQSRDELRRSLSRLGQTLSSSLDLNRTLAVVTETAMDTLSADRALLRLYTAERDALYLKVGRGLDEDVPRLRAGEGIAGQVASSGIALRLPADAERAPRPAPHEPIAPHLLAVPMHGRGRVIGVLTLLRDDPEQPFTQDDLDTLRSFAAQSSVAIENVLLHREAQRLSVTDPLTGLWNFRYFQLQADRELESARRFRRPLSLVIADIDHFKEVNDRHGHQVGDEVLIEVARRLQTATRVPDVVARYGGEEFVVLLPGTGFDGALATAERIRLAVGSAPVEVAAGDRTGPLTVSCSLGVAANPEHGTTVAGLLRSADAAMYVAKTRGRNRVVGAGSSGTPALESDRA